MARNFSSGNQEFFTGVVDAGANIASAFTFAMLCQLNDITTTRTIWRQQDSSSTDAATVGFAADKLTVTTATTVTGPASTALDTTSWWIVAVSHQAGATTPRFHVKNLTTNSAWVHADGVGTIADPFQQSPGGNIQYGGANANFIIAVSGMWNVSLSDLGVEVLSANLSTNDWVTTSVAPKYVHDWNQTSPTDQVKNQATGAYDSTAQSGTTVTDDPPGWTFLNLTTPNPAAQTVAITNTGGGTLNWTASKTQSWLTLSPSSGTAPSTLTVQPVTGALTPGTYNDTITIAATGASNTPQTIAVQFVVNAGTPHISPSGINSGEAFGTTLVAGKLSLAPGGIASAESFGSLAVNKRLAATGIASAESFGTATATARPPAWIVGSSTAGFQGVNATVTPPIPTGTQAGDVMFAIVHVRTTAAPAASVLADPPGWSLVATRARGSVGRAWLYRRAASGSDTAPNFTISGSSGNGPLQAAIVTVRGANASTPVDAEIDASATSANQIMPAVTTTHNNETLLRFVVTAVGGASGSYTWLTPVEIVDFTSPAVDAAVGTIGVAWDFQPTFGVSTTPTATYTASGSYAAFTVALNNFGVGPTTVQPGGIPSAEAFGRLWRRTPVDILVENFVDTNNVLLQNHISDSNHNWSLHPSYSNTSQIIANRLQAVTANVASLYIADAIPSSANYEHTGVFVIKTIADRAFPGVAIRVSPTSDDYYLVRPDTAAGAHKVQLFLVQSSPTPQTVSLGTWNTTFVDNQVVKVTLRGNGPNLSVFVDDVLRITATDSTITAAGRLGVRTGQINTPFSTTGIHVESLNSNYLAAAAPIAPTGIASAEAFGTAAITLLPPPTVLAFGPDDSIISEEAFGSVMVSRYASELVETFAGTDIDPAKWYRTYEQDSFISGGRFVLPASNGGIVGADPTFTTGLFSTVPYLLRDGESIMFDASVDLQGGIFTASFNDDSFSSQQQFWIQSTTLSMSSSVDADWYQNDIAYDPVAHRWLRWHVVGTDLLYETSPDSLTWTTQWTVPTGQWRSMGKQLQFTFTPAGLVGGGQASLDNINVPAQKVTASGIASAEQFGALTATRLGPAAKTVAPTSIASAQAFGTAALSQRKTLTLTGIASAEAFGTTKINRRIFTTGIASAEGFGTALVKKTKTLAPTGIPSTEAFGSAVVNRIKTLSGVGAIASQQAFGTAKLNSAIRLTGIASAQAFGSAKVGAFGAITAAGIPSAEAFGTFKLRQSLPLAGIASAQAFGTLRLALALKPTGIASVQAFGTPTLLRRNTLTVTGIVSSEAFGSARINRTLPLAGITSAEAFGILTRALPPAKTVSSTGIASAQAFGTLVVKKTLTLRPSGIASAQGFGTFSIRSVARINVVGIPSAEAFGVTFRRFPFSVVRYRVGFTGGPEPTVSITGGGSADTFTSGTQPPAISTGGVDLVVLTSAIEPNPYTYGTQPAPWSTGGEADAVLTGGLEIVTITGGIEE